MWQTLTTTFCGLGESPFWHPHERSLYWIDIPGRALLRTRGEIGTAPVVERWAMPADPGCIAPARRGGLVIALRDGIYRATEWGGALQRMTAVDYDQATTRFNDGKCDALGRFWAGTLFEPKDQRIATLYCLDARARAQGHVPVMTRMVNDAVTANGLAFAPDRRTLYWADTAAHAVRVWDWAAEPNALSRPRVFRQFDLKPAGWTADTAHMPTPTADSPDSSITPVTSITSITPVTPATRPAYEGRPDGATIDAAGNYWVAMFEGAQLLCFSPSGEQIAALPLPVQCPTMPCLGGDDLRTLFVTSARQGRSAAELARLPASGAVIAMQVDAPGVPVCFFEE